MTDSPVEPDDVRHVAALARVDLDEDEVDEFTGQFVDILEYFDALDDVPETTDDPERVNVMRDDEPIPSIDRDGALSNAHEHIEGYFKGPKVS